MIVNIIIVIVSYYTLGLIVSNAVWKKDTAHLPSTVTNPVMFIFHHLIVSTFWPYYIFNKG